MGKPLVLFSIRELHQIDGGELENDFNDQLRRLVADCMDRPGIDKNRTLKLEIQLSPDKKSDGTCDDVFVECFTSSKMPSRPVRPYRMSATKNGGLKFSPSSPLNTDSLPGPEEDE